MIFNYYLRGVNGAGGEPIRTAHLLRTKRESPGLYGETSDPAEYGG